MVAKSAFFTLGTVILLHHGSSMSTGRTRREGNGYLEVPAEAHFAPLWSGDHLRHHPAADDLNVAWFPVHRGRFVVDQTAERAKDAAHTRVSRAAAEFTRYREAVERRLRDTAPPPPAAFERMGSASARHLRKKRVLSPSVHPRTPVATTRRGYGR